ncbi:hypothetical protein M3Y97_00058300 [Aphelenchoides bicaudatus]|nr:hypothetical protein M3Y97_00058300 [Aphelenchoides bicaudatus]
MRKNKQPTMRLLLTLLIILPATNSWSLFGFGESQADSVSLHPLSPVEADARTLRIKRQAYQVNIDGDVTVTLDSGNTIETGSFGPWHREGDCSRSCGGGVYKEKRECNGECAGPLIRYHSCNLEECPEDSVDFRTQQCASHNDEPLDGKYYKWVPYAAFYYKWADKVVDGTKCDKLNNDICVDGICLPLGCDGKLGSTSKLDQCGVCNGNGTTCKSHEGVIKESSLTSGYNNIIVLPVGATSIKIEENRPTSNSLAIKNENGNYSLNGNHQIVLSNQDIAVGGTVFKYQKAKTDSSLPERLVAAGPLKEELTIQLLFQRAPHGSTVKYSYSTPLDEDIQYIYKPGEWSQCSVTCGKGVQTRSVYCTDTQNQQRVGDEICDDNNSTKPDLEKPCQTVDCEADWFTGEWEECSETCGNHGWQYRVVYCHKLFANGKRMTVDDSNCTNAERPPVKQTCNRYTCPEWHAGPWSACSEKCGDAKQYRAVTCRSQKEGEEAKLLPAGDCPAEVEFESERLCNLGPCDGLTFSTTEWDLCERCNDTTETRNVTCKDETGRLYPLEKCLDDKVTEIPVDNRPCATQPPCEYEWHVSEWSDCSTKCGHGHKERKVHCAINELGSIKILDESLCTAEKPETRENCTNEEKCTGTYYTGPWSNCTEQCGGGTQDRFIVCLNYDKMPVPDWCDEAARPVEKQDCNIDPCPTCIDSDFGCCPDNVTFAQGDWYEGCSNCSLSEFGCCADNVTEAAGPDFYGCDEYIETTPGSGEEPTETTESAQTEEDECEATNEETGEIAKILCSAINKTSDFAEALLLGNDTDVENQTIHCSKTEFGCCPDWYTPAEGKDFAGCPEFVLGACNETTHGCCPDGVTLARGPDFQGCGEPACSASRFGCCKDRQTIAFGPHFGGCDRSSFHCETSKFGCCPDGETAALDKNGTGCGSSCLLTKWGCCPDGKAAAKGAQNEGCGCKYSQFGCCPDLVTPAKGPSFYGCKESCSQSTYDGKTPARGPNRDGCPCQYTRFGCCKDGETPALGPRQDGCDDCRRSKWGCCQDGKSKAFGPQLQGCPTTTPGSYVVDGTVSPQRIVSCNLPQNKGEVGPGGYQLAWFYDTSEGRCSQFWYGGAGGNENRFHTQEECDTVCVEPPEVGRCYLPKVEGPQRCNNLVARYWYDYTTKQCAAYWWRGCLGNANSFENWESCMEFCKGVGPFEQEEQPVVVPVSGSFEPSNPRHQDLVQPQEQQPWAPVDEDNQRRQQIENQRKANEEHQLRVEEQRQSDERQREEHQRQIEQHRLAEQRRREEQERLRTQQQKTSAPAQNITSSNNDWNVICRLTVDAGPCTNGYQDAYYFDQFTGSCYPFIYTGCGGNANRFTSRGDCELRCGHLSSRNKQTGGSVLGQPTPKTSNQQASERRSSDVCNQPKDVGRCTGHFNRYYYDRDLGTCELFQYSGCGGNQNKFNSRAECTETCLRTVSQPQIPAVPQNLGQPAPVQSGDRCDGPKDHGPCSNFVLKWWFSKEDGTCSKFYYGGNSNLHETEQDCIDACANSVDVCQLPSVKGPCEGNRKKWYFDKNSRTCQEFTFGGCLGNKNNFQSKEACEQRCLSQDEDLQHLPENLPKRRFARLDTDAVDVNSLDADQSNEQNVDIDNSIGSVEPVSPVEYSTKS